MSILIHALEVPVVQAERLVRASARYKCSLVDMSSAHRFSKRFFDIYDFIFHASQC